MLSVIEATKRFGEHTAVNGVSLEVGAAAIAMAIPLGIIAAKQRKLAQPILWCVGILQTMPSLALLVLLIPAFGMSPLTAIVALFLYSLLPIVRNTYSGLLTPW